MTNSRLQAKHLLLLLIPLLAISCAGGSQPTSGAAGRRIEELPSAVLDDEPGGIYRGVIAVEEATGTFALRLPPSDRPGEIPIFYFSLEAAGGRRIRTEEPGETERNGEGRVASFDGTVGAGSQELELFLSLRLDASGRVVETTAEIDGAPTAVVAAKELSNRAVRTYEGRFIGTSEGVWNMILTGTTVLAAYAEEPRGVRGVLRGERRNDTLILAGPQQLVRARGEVSPTGELEGEWSEKLEEPGAGRFSGAPTTATGP